jgi:hypothetical protein
MPAPAGSDHLKSAGRTKQIVLRGHVTLIEKVDAWRAAQEDEPSQAEAIRRLVKLGLQTDQ